jgi:D-glycero-alpha-D-manno-heptose-7-phosphate kinase
LTDPFLAALIGGDMKACGEILDEGWQKKKKLSDAISNEFIDAHYATALANGAMGGKLLGAGGGGFLLFIVDPNKRDHLRQKMAPLQELDFNFDFFGSSIIFVEGDHVGS